MKRALVLIAIVLLALFCAGVLSAARACAHDPRFACSPRDASNPVVITDPQKSWAFYGHLEGGRQDFYEIETPKTVDVSVQLLVDRRDADNPARPVARVADASGRLIATIDLVRMHQFYEPFSRVTYLESPDRIVRLPAGTSTVVVGMRAGAAPQRYTLAIGSDERFSILEIPYLLGAVARIHARRF